MFKCPECDGWLVFDGVDQGGQHWHCPNCGRKDGDYKTEYSYHTEVDKNQKIVSATNTL